MGNLKHQYVLFASLLLGACGQTISTDANNTETGLIDSSNGIITSVRQCEGEDKHINNSNTSLLSGFFSTVVRELENAPTFCQYFAGTGSNVDAALMIEYEDDFGIRSLQLGSENLIASQLRNVGSSTIAEAIFRDGYGLAKIIASGPQSTGVLTGEIRYYNFPSFEEALNTEIQRLQQECQDGTKTVYECLGYTYPQHWWNQPLYTSQGQQMLELAKEIMRSGSGEYTVLGHISFDAGVSTWP